MREYVNTALPGGPVVQRYASRYTSHSHLTRAADLGPTQTTRLGELGSRVLAAGRSPPESFNTDAAAANGRSCHLHSMLGRFH